MSLPSLIVSVHNDISCIIPWCVDVTMETFDVYQDLYAHNMQLDNVCIMIVLSLHK